ncbi:hypothetical protein ACVQKW_04535 [Edwardsiella tarda]|uniref:Lipoprotein n=2 Tax=Edwardsiella tarda TaxID=636 RepID=D4FAM8_EDWTA|nr:hypothetical protein [Edwardsiella tarda]EFE21059.1 hypothetical protein EDWATA_03849 [Edwardsiella tarda ATCC 23685]UAL56599.1 hypothetical protein K8O98_01055 [Edwardsiella tarda]UBU95236.1 hypothetical protein AAW15_16305 [Edwardsiella tarda]UCQ00346.1 hypothetical protein DCL27_00625 [Edwardsiella tarda ATCC 15947 = NBRC 105688]UCQ11447.1 hypothetical protein DCF76_00365 [Edwardsiella tarda]
MRYIVLLLAALVLSGCAHTPPVHNNNFGNLADCGMCTYNDTFYTSFDE